MEPDYPNLKKEYCPLCNQEMIPRNKLLKCERCSLVIHHKNKERLIDMLENHEQNMIEDQIKVEI